MRSNHLLIIKVLQHVSLSIAVWKPVIYFLSVAISSGLCSPLSSLCSLIPLYLENIVTKTLSRLSLTFSSPVARCSPIPIEMIWWEEPFIHLETFKIVFYTINFIFLHILMRLLLIINIHFYSVFRWHVLTLLSLNTLTQHTVPAHIHCWPIRAQYSVFWPVIDQSELRLSGGAWLVSVLRWFCEDSEISTETERTDCSWTLYNDFLFV